jgi:proton-coupled amino acid transporter
MLHYRAVARSTTARVVDVVVCIIGLVGMVYTTTLTVNSWVAGGTKKAPGYCDSRMP